MRRKFGLKEAILGSFLAGAGCAGEEAGAKGDNLEQDSATVEVLKPEEISKDNTDGVFYIPDKVKNHMKVGGNDKNIKEVGGAKKIEQEQGKVKQFENYLLEEIVDLLQGETLPGFDKEAEIKRVIPKVIKAYHDKMFGESYDVYMKKYFSRLLKDNEYRDDVKEHIEKYCEEYDVPVSVAMGVMGVESGGDNNLVSHKDAHGVFQIKQDAADQLKKVKFNNEDWSGINIDNLEDNIRVGVAYLRYLHDNYTGQWGLALMAYNTGPGNFKASVATRLYRYENKQFKAGNLHDKPKKWEVGSKVVRDKETKKKKRIFVDEVGDNYPGGWSAFINDNNIDVVSGCSRAGLGQCEYGYGSYPLHAMALSETVNDIFENGEKTKFKPLTENSIYL